MPRLTLQSGRQTTPIGFGEEGPLADAGNEQHLLARAAAGDPGAFDALIALHEPRVRRLTRRLLGWRDDGGEVDDIVQDVFLRLLENVGRFRGDATLATWLTTVTLNRCRALLRRRWVRRKWLRVQSRNQSRTQDVAPSDHHETSTQVRAAVQALNAKDREVIVLFYLEERSIAEIASLLATSPNAIEVRLHRARSKLKTMLSDLVEE